MYGFGQRCVKETEKRENQYVKATFKTSETGNFIHSDHVLDTLLFIVFCE